MIQFDGPSIERTNLQTWDFDALPRQLDTKQGSNKVSAFPALVLDEKTNTVDLKLHSSEARQALGHPSRCRGASSAEHSIAGEVHRGAPHSGREASHCKPAPTQASVLL